MTEQTGQNPEVLQDLPAMHAGADPQSDAPVVPQQAGWIRAGSCGAVAEEGTSGRPATTSWYMVPSTVPSRGDAPTGCEPVAEDGLR